MTANPTVRIGDGTVRGCSQDGVAVFCGIPYAAAPVGARRFSVPVPPSWHGEFDATAFAPTAPQASTRLRDGLDLNAILGPGWVPGTEYLALNVWTPDTASGGLPVMVFIHGGAFTTGSGSATGYDGTRFAQHGVILVTLNYRLGVVGFAHLPDAPNNRGLRDQIAALLWIRRNVRAFGGNPDNITVLGESAGALSVGSLLAAAPAGLFRRAISQSGGGSHTLTRAQARATTAAVAARLGVAASAEDFATVSDRALVNALTQVSQSSLNLTVPGQRDPLMGLSPLGPVIDGDLLHEQPVDAVCGGAAANVDLLVGHNLDEMNLYLVAVSNPAVVDNILRAAVSRLHPEPDRVIDNYRAAARGTTNLELLSAIGTDYMFAVPTARLATAHSRHLAGTWRYEFTWQSTACGGRLGACHGIELPFVFAGIDRIDYGMFDAHAEHENATQLAEQMHFSWIRFASEGNPGWPQHTIHRPTVQQIGPQWKTTSQADGPERTVWNGIR